MNCLNINININIKRRLQIARIALASLLAMFACAQLSAQTNNNWTEVNLSVVDNQVIPRYAELETTTALLSTKAEAFCSKLDQASLNELQQSYSKSMDAWEAIQHIQFGPITYFNWNFRLQYWPDDKGTGGRQLNALISSQDQDALNSDNFARQSVGVQGFPALERLLFDSASLEELKDDRYRCQVLETISGNISEISKGVHLRWQDEFRTIVANADDSDDFESAEDATIDFLKALVESIPRIVDQKLTPVLGESFETSRIRRAESWRSESSLRNIKTNLLTLSELFSGSSDANGEEVVQLSSVLLQEDVEGIEKIFSEINSNLMALPDSMPVALESKELYPLIKDLSAQLVALDEALEAALKNTDLYLGFNSLDGD